VQNAITLCAGNKEESAPDDPKNWQLFFDRDGPLPQSIKNAPPNAPQVSHLLLCFTIGGLGCVSTPIPVQTGPKSGGSGREKQ
jgi:hypothetical protein